MDVIHSNQIGLITGKGEPWKRGRRIISPTYSVSKVKQVRFLFLISHGQNEAIFNNMWRNFRKGTLSHTNDCLQSLAIPPFCTRNQ